MEQDIALLIADLSGYTALTEAHGAATAADFVDKYVEIINESLVGDCLLHQSIGDEVLVVSSSPDHLLCTAQQLMQRLSIENKFLQVHGALHYDKLLIRNNSYYGTAINLTSRIASRAGSGSFLCSHEFINALSNKADVCTRSIGRHSFKNLSEEKEIFELLFQTDEVVLIDPVCRMVIKKKETATRHPYFDDVVFCSESCRDIYIKNSIA